MELGLAAKVAVVGGASQGIGLAVAELLAAEHARVVMFARRAERLEPVVQRIREAGGDVIGIPADNRRPEDLARVVSAAVEHFGRLDVVVNNDGAPPLGRVEEFDDEDWSRAWNQNAMSVIRMVNAALPHLRAAGGGSIVNVTSLSALQPLANFGLSTATWAGTISYAKTASIELGPENIRINTVCPGRIATPRSELVGRQTGDALPPDIPLGRLGLASEVADVVGYLASARSSYVTGAVIQVDGGRRRSLF